MSGRDHSETCEVCGDEYGGFNDTLCSCEIDDAVDSVATYGEAHKLVPTAQFAQLRADLARVTAERDEANACIEYLRAELREKRDQHDVAIGHAEYLESERDALRAKCQAMHDEREGLLARLNPAHRESIEDWRTMQATLKHEHAEETRLRALLPTEAERDALEAVVRAYCRENLAGLTDNEPERIALAYLDRLLGGGR